MLELNRNWLHHNSLTDILTFPFAKGTGLHFGRHLHQYWRRVEENAKKFDEPKEKELRRVMIHGVLHLIGYRDKTGAEKKEMRGKEDYYLAI